MITVDTRLKESNLDTTETVSVKTRDELWLLFSFVVRLEANATSRQIFNLFRQTIMARHDLF